MSIFSGTISTGVRDDSDYFISEPSGLPDVDVTGTTTIKASHDNDLNNIDKAYMWCNTSGLTVKNNIVITAATFHWYDSSYTISRGLSVNSSIDIRSYDAGSFAEIYNFTSKPSAGWKSHALTSEELEHINVSGETQFRFRTKPFLDVGKYSRWEIGASEDDKGAYLVVEYVVLFFPKKRAFYRPASRVIIS